MHIDSHFPEAVAAFFARGGRITTCPGFSPQPKPARTAWVDPETKLYRQPKPAPVAMPVDPAPEVDDEDARIVTALHRLAAAGHTKVSAAEVLGITEKMVRIRAKRHAIPFAAGTVASDAELIPQLQALLAAGASQKKIIAQLRIGYRRLRRLIKDNDIKLRD